MTRQHIAIAATGSQGRRKTVSGCDLEWERDGAGWPNHAASRIVDVAGQRLHVQVAGSGPVLLLLHGTAGSTHTWRDMLSPLAHHFTVVAPDLPGHAFSSYPGPVGVTLAGMAAAVVRLVHALGVEPDLIVGHSAGAAIAMRMCLDQGLAPTAIVSLNGALLPFQGIAGHLYPPLARALFTNPLAIRLVNAQARSLHRIERLVHRMGSRIDHGGLQTYARLFRSPRHVRAAIGMMAAWDLRSLERDLPRLEIRTFLVAATGDLAVPSDVAFDVADRLPYGEVILLRGLGHLAHEEDPAGAVRLIEEMWSRCGEQPPRSDP
ncbi:MAG: alpha/beta fold hydrolase [Rhizobiales bacterium]|nr:alpha/beta fold hydrolase [Hyphomicrobiales bacterium]